MNPYLKFATLAAAAFLAIAAPECLLPTFREAAIAQTTQDRKAESDRLLKQGDYAVLDGNYPTAIRYYQEALEIYQQIGEQKGQIDALGWLGSAYESQGNLEKAIDYAQRGLAMAQRIGDGYREADLLMVLSRIYESQANFAKAVGYAQQSWHVAQKIKNPKVRELAQNSSLTRLMLVYSKLGDDTKANEYRAIAKRLEEQRLAQERQQLLQANPQGNRKAEMNALASLASNYELQGNHSGLRSDYIKAASYYIQAIAAARKILDHPHESLYLSNLGALYLSKLNDPRQAINYYKQLLLVAQGSSDQSTALFGLARSYSALTLYDQAINYYQELLTQARARQSSLDESIALDSLASEYFRTGNYSKAAEYYKLKILFAEARKSHVALIAAWLDLGKTYKAMRNYSIAVESYYRALILAQSKQDRQYEMKALKNIGDVFVQQNQAQLATAFYKQAVNVTEMIRQDLHLLPKQQQEAYTQSVADTYRTLADLLLQQNRVIEAMQVLDLLKVQDLQDFLKDLRGNALTAQGVELLPQETAILQAFDASQKQSLDTFLKNPTIQTQVQALQRTGADQNLKLNAYQDLQARIQKLGNNIALFYPLILDDRLELVVLTKDRPPIHKPVDISRKELETEIQTFRQQLQARSPKIKEPAQQLYQRLIQPIEAELKAAGVETIVYAPDSIMRYVPLAALHDGNQWLAQRYQINYLTALALTPLDKPATPTPRVLAGAVTKEYSPIVNGEKYTFPALSQTQTEVEQIAQRYPNTQVLIDTQLNRGAIETNLSNSNVVHLATHAAFLSGSPDASFILLGDGSTLNLRDLSTFQLPNVSLFVLSACETALGEKLGNGIEIFGFGYQLQRNQVRASLASLWQVSDGGTQVLMKRFYEQLKQGKTVAKAMQQVQQDFLDRKVTVEEMQQVRASYSASFPTKQLNRASAGPYVEGGIPTDLTHPYYWAPFILIGNGL